MNSARWWDGIHFEEWHSHIPSRPKACDCYRGTDLPEVSAQGHCTA